MNAVVFDKSNFPDVLVIREVESIMTLFRRKTATIRSSRTGVLYHRMAYL